LSAPDPTAPRAGSRELTLAELVASLRRRRTAIAAACLLGILVAAGFTISLWPTYVARARVRVVESSQMTGIAAQLASLPFAGLIGSSPSVAAEIEVVRSRPIVEAVIDPPGVSELAPDVGLDLTDVLVDLDRARMWRQVTRKLTSAPEPAGRLSVDVERWEFDAGFDRPLELRFEEGNRVRIAIDRLFDARPTTLAFTPGEPLEYEGATLRLAPEGELAGRSFLVGRRERAELIDLFLDRLAVRETAPGSSVLSIGYADVSAEHAAEVANAIVRAYMAQNQRRKSEAAGQTAGFLEAELERIHAELALAEERLQEFARESGDIVVPETARVLVQELIQADVNRAMARLEARTNAALLERLVAGEMSHLELAGLEATVLEGPDPATSMASLITARSALLSEYTEEWPDVKAIDARIAERTGTLEAALRQRVAGNDALVADLDGIVEKYGERLAGLPETQIELLRHRRSVESFGQIYGLILEELEKARIAESSAVPSVEVIEWAAPPRLRSKPAIKINLLVGALVGLVLGLGFALLRELARPLTTAAQAEEVLGACVLHAVPRARSRTPLVVRDHPGGPEAESYRALMPAVEHALRSSKKNTLAVAGARAGDGASRTAANLASALARAGRRVLLVDCDQEEGVVARWFDRPAADGLAAALEGEAAWSEAVQASGVEGLSLLVVSGEASTRDLAGSQRLPEFLREAASAYDVVLFDAPPVLERADASLIATAAGSVLLVCHSERLSEREAAEAAARVRRAGAEVLGVVFNGTRRTDAAVV
jgi:tyrosine-protein kinase Etk/Wzc